MKYYKNIDLLKTCVDIWENNNSLINKIEKSNSSYESLFSIKIKNDKLNRIKLKLCKICNLKLNNIKKLNHCSFCLNINCSNCLIKIKNSKFCMCLDCKLKKIYYLKNKEFWHKKKWNENTKSNLILEERSENNILEWVTRTLDTLKKSSNVKQNQIKENNKLVIDEITYLNIQLNGLKVKFKNIKKKFKFLEKIEINFLNILKYKNFKENDWISQKKANIQLKKVNKNLIIKIRLLLNKLKNKQKLVNKKINKSSYSCF